MAVDTGSKDGLEGFAAGHGLSFASSASLPSDGSLLGRGGKVEGSVSGALAAGLEGTLSHYIYTTTSTDSDGHTSTEHHRFTILVTQVPESIGFAPYLSYRGPGSSIGVDVKQGLQRLKLLEGDAFKGASLYAFDGASKSWLTQLFSPALIDWLARSPDGFGFELSGGVLCVGRDGYLSDRSELESLCTDAAHVAAAIRKESLEGAETGSGASEGAHSHAPDPSIEKALAEVAPEAAPEHLGAMTGSFRGHLARSPGTYMRSLAVALGIAALLNIPGIALPIVFIVNGWYGPLIAIEGALVLVIFYFALRGRVRDLSKTFDTEAFFHGYARSRHLSVEDPLQFAATHAEAKLPFKPERVFTGALPGDGTADAALALKGDGTKREDRVAVVAGPSGPVASTELQATAPGLSASDLDTYAAALTEQLRSPAAASPSRT